MRILFAAVLAMVATTAAAQDGPDLLLHRAPEERPKLLILGSAHFANPGRDLINASMPDITTPDRQAEIEDAVRQLAALSPTHVAIEWPADAQTALDESYNAYRAGDRALETREAEQIGFRLAAAAGLERVHAIDWNGNPSGPLEAYDWPAYAGANGQQALFAAIADPANRATLPLQGRTIASWLREVNRPEALAAAHRLYFDIAMIGGEDEQPGANWVGHWYGRNLRIFRNLVRLADSPDDVVVAVYGHGHAHLLRQFARESGAFELVDVEEVLADAP